MEKRLDIIQGVVNDWGQLLGLPKDYCRVFMRNEDERHTSIYFKDQSINRKVLEFGEFSKDFHNIPLKFLKEDVDKFFEKISLLLYASKNKESYMIRNITESGDVLCIRIDEPGIFGIKRENSKVLKLLNKIQAKNTNNIYTCKKEELYAYYLFFNKNEEQ